MFHVSYHQTHPCCVTYLILALIALISRAIEHKTQKEKRKQNSLNKGESKLTMTFHAIGKEKRARKNNLRPYYRNLIGRKLPVRKNKRRFSFHAWFLPCREMREDGGG